MSKYESPSLPNNLVADILDDKIYLKNILERTINALKDIGALPDEIAGRQYWLLNYANDEELARKLHELNQLGFLFIGGPTGWPPSEVFNYVRKKKLLDEKFNEITWRGPGDWVIRER